MAKGSNFNLSGGSSRQDRQKVARGTSAQNDIMKNFGILLVGIVILFAAFIVATYGNYSDSSDGVNFASFLPWILGVLGGILFVVGCYRMNGHNEKEQAKRQLNSEKRAAKRAAKAEKKAAKRR